MIGSFSFGTASRFKVAGFVPTDIAGLKLWLRADMGVTESGGAVSAWADQSGTGDTNKNVVQGTAANKPTYTASHASYGNKPAIVFDLDDQLLSAAWAVALAQPLTLFLAGHTTTRTTNHYMFDNRTDPSQCALYDSTAGSGVTIYAGAAIAAAVASTDPKITCCVFNGASSTILVNQKTAQATGNAGANGLTGTSIGNYAAGGSFGNNGPVAEVIVYSGALSASDIDRVMDYLGARYGITIGA